MKLTESIIDKLSVNKTITKPDHDDVENSYTFSNGLELSTLSVCNNSPCKIDSLEGLDGFIYITTKEELEVLIEKDFETICKELKEEHEDFDYNNYI